MVNSSLVNYTHITNKRNPRQGNPVRKIIIHHCAGVMSCEGMASTIDNPNREMSCNYCVDKDGRVGLYVPEEYRSWCSSGWDADKDSITIETSNDSTGGEWHVGDVTLNKLIDLVADICRRYGLTPTYTGDKRGTIQEHRMWANTSCPGPYLHSKMGYIAEEARKRMGITPKPQPQKPTTPTGKINVVHQVLAQGAGWQPEVTNYNTVNSDGYSGYMGHAMVAFRAKTPGDEKVVGNLEYRVHCLGGGWYNWRRDYQKDSSGDTFAGVGNTQLDGLQMRLVNCSGHNIRYRVHVIGGGWLDWVTGYGNGANGYAGLYGKAIDAVQAEVI